MLKPNQPPTTPAECGWRDARDSGGRWFLHKPRCYRAGKLIEGKSLTADEAREYTKAFAQEFIRKGWDD